MGIRRQQWHAIAALGVTAAVVAVVAAEGRNSSLAGAAAAPPPEHVDGKAYHHVWPQMEIGWRIVLPCWGH
ncbi:unnamed protein product [Urochloa humidicola]